MADSVLSAHRRASPENDLLRGSTPGTRPAMALWVGIGLYVLTTAGILARSLQLTRGVLVYPLDDPYITMAMAKNLALHGVWGITPFAFSSSCSSPLFLLLLATVYRFTGAVSWVPLLLSWSFGLGCVVAGARLLRGRVSQAAETIALAALVLFPPLFGVGTLGMEHSLHLLLSLGFLAAFARFDGRNGLPVLCLLAAAMCGVRYEGLFLAAMAVLLLLFGRRWVAALAVCVSAWLPVLLYAIYSIAQGGTWLPNSVALKGLRGQYVDLASRLHASLATLATNLSRGAPLTLLLLALLALLGSSLVLTRRKERSQSEAQGLSLLRIVCGATALHLLLADVGWAFRYEDYLIGCGVVVAAPPLRTLFTRNRSAATLVSGLFVLAALLLGVRATLAANLLPRYAQAIAMQQAQTAEFLARHYPGASIAAGDVGLINFRNDLHCLDLTGLASTEVFEAKRHGRFTSAEIAAEARAADVQIAIVYESWFSNDPRKRAIPLFGPPLPAGWVRVGRWVAPETLQLGDRTLSFYAVDPAAEAPLREHLRQFRAALPPQVQSLQN